MLRTAWRLATGALVAVGVAVSGQLFGWLPTVLLLAGLWAFYTVTLHGVMSEVGHPLRRSADVAAVAAVTTVVLVGTSAVAPVAGPATVAVCLLTSPPVTVRLGALVRRLEQASVDRAFTRIVADLESGGSGRRE